MKWQAMICQATLLCPCDPCREDRFRLWITRRKAELRYEREEGK